MNTEGQIEFVGFPEMKLKSQIHLIQYRCVVLILVGRSGSFIPPSCMSWINTLYAALPLLPPQKKSVMIFLYYMMTRIVVVVLAQGYWRMDDMQADMSKTFPFIEIERFNHVEQIVLIFASFGSKFNS